MDFDLASTMHAAQIANGPPVVFEYAGRRIVPATRGVAWYRLRYTEWGRDNQYESTVIVPRASMPDRANPPSMAECTVNNQPRRILQVDEDASGDTLYLSIGGRRHRG